MTRKLALLCILVSLFVLPNSAFCADRDVPLSMWSARDRLLRDRTQYLNQRAELNQRIVALRAIQCDMDKLLAAGDLSGERYTDLTSARSQAALLMTNLQRRLDIIEKFLIENNKDLANIDYHIQRYACLR